ncbi:hypothetical protein BDZ89DRAFT_1156893 [Hymenopellis radicata]|nr:hypothetical protein BDZ89DRAFT_1156893 [Hymenopellis radicata]
MVRQPAPLPSSRNRNRVTFKTRLRIHVGEHQADTSILDDDTEKTRQQQRVFGVDQEDANEHHLQQVLSAAAAAHADTAGATSSSSTATPAAYIPTPDSTGIVHNYPQLYPSNRYKDPATYVCSSRTVEESSNGGLAHGICYYMDEKDKEWVDRINEEARGEGTSAQAALSMPRTSGRSTKAKGKEAESIPPITMSEDEFELVMGLFELITHEETEYLHHSLQSGMEFPEFSNYQDVFAQPLPANLFALFEVPVWTPQPPQLLRMARLVYPYWRERKMERGGHRIIPTLNGDESDTLNESYVCFRHREVKAVRKTRASQVNPSEKLTALQKQFAEPLELARKILGREDMKSKALDATFPVWRLRMEMVDLKRANPLLGSKADDEKLLLDKEKPPAKKLDTRSRVHSHHKRDSLSVAPSSRAEPALRPSHRSSIVATEIETALLRRKDTDQDWEMVVDNAYIAPFVAHAARHFKFILSAGTPSWPKASSSSSSDPEQDSEQTLRERKPLAVRTRVGRGGRMMVDRRRAYSSTVPNFRARQHAPDEDDVERQRRLAERWRYDTDDAPLVPPEGSEEQDRMLVDDYGPLHLSHSMRLVADVDPALITDPSIVTQTPEGKKETVIPFKFGFANASNIVPAARTSVHQQPASVSSQHLLSTTPGLNNIRKASNLRNSIATPLPAPTTTTNGTGRAAMTMPHIEPVKMEGIQDGHPILSHAQLKTAFANVDRGEMAKYIPPALRPPQWNGSPPQAAVDSPLRKPTPNVTSSAATQNY